MKKHQQLFTQLPGNARVWIYQSNRELLPSETQQVESLLKNFAQQWTSHSEKVVADGAVVYNRFIVLTADETFVKLGGCSIDSSVKIIRQIEQQFNIVLFDRLSIAYRVGETINVTDQNTFQKLLEEGKVHANTIVFNNLVSTLSDFYSGWETPLNKSWHARVFSPPTTEKI